MEKYCPRCEQTLSTDKFTKSAGRYDGLQAYCRECMKAYRLEHYRSNKQQYYNRNLKTEAKLREYVLEIKKNPCMDCGITYQDEPWLMEFDHRVASDKLGLIAKFVKNGSKRLLDEELAKCDLLCVVCHRRRTARRAGWVDNRLASVLA